MQLNKSDILITGGCGFIGGDIVKQLVHEGALVTVVDTKLDPNSLFARESLSKKTNLKVIDVRDRTKILNLFKRCQPDYIIHLAAEPIVEKAYKDPYSTFDTNIMGTVNILEAARSCPNIKGIIVASSDKAYGKTKTAYTENSPLKGDHPYDVSKSCEDLIAQTYFKTYKLPIVITRCGNVYGEGDVNFNRIIPGICKSIIKNEILELRSDGTFIRDYVYINDVANAYIFLLKKLGNVKGEAFNISSKDTLSVIKVVKKAEKILNVKIPYKILNNSKNEIPYQHLNDQKINKLGWQAEFNLETSLNKTLSWYKMLYRL